VARNTAKLWRDFNHERNATKSDEGAFRPGSTHWWRTASARSCCSFRSQQVLFDGDHAAAETRAAQSAKGSVQVFRLLLIQSRVRWLSAVSGSSFRVRKTANRKAIDTKNITTCPIIA
jgi:hypothetical protein